MPLASEPCHFRVSGVAPPGPRYQPAVGIEPLGAVTVGGVVSRGGAGGEPIAATAATRSSRWYDRLFRLSLITGPVPERTAWIWSGVAVGFCAARTATAPATCGAACEVPLSVSPAAVISEPGASSVSPRPP